MHGSTLHALREQLNAMIQQQPWAHEEHGIWQVAAIVAGGQTLAHSNSSQNAWNQDYILYNIDTHAILQLRRFRTPPMYHAPPTRHSIFAPTAPPLQSHIAMIPPPIGAPRPTPGHTPTAGRPKPTGAPHAANDTT